MNATPAIPVLPGLPLVGNLLQFRSDRLRLFKSLRELGDVCHAKLGPYRVLVLSSGELAHGLLVEHDVDFKKSPGLRDFGRPLLGKGLLTADLELHRRQRKMISPAFQHKRVSAYATTMVEDTERAQAGWKDGARVDAAAEMMKLTLSIVGKTLFDVDVAGESREIGEALTVANHFILEAVTSFFPVPPSWPIPRNIKNRRAIDRLDATIYRIIRERRGTTEDHGDFLSMLLAAQDESDGKGMSDEQVRDEAMTLFLAGHETTANALAWALMLLAEHPEVYAKIRAEADDVLGGRAPTFEDVPRLPYAQMVFKEVMRLYPPAYVIGRQAVRETKIGAVKVEKGQLAFVNVHAMHRRPDYFADPERFNPERFAPGAPEPPKLGYMPFGAGPRVCIGNHFAMMEGQLVLAALAQRVVFERASSGIIEPEPLVTLRPKGGVPMIVRRRDRSVS